MSLRHVFIMGLDAECIQNTEKYLLFIKAVGTLRNERGVPMGVGSIKISLLFSSPHVSEKCILCVEEGKQVNAE